MAQHEAAGMKGGPLVVRPRPIRTGEEAMVYALIDRCYREYGIALNLNDPIEAHLHDPGAHFRAEGGNFWVLCDERGVVRATCALRLDRSGAQVGAELKSMYVDLPWRRRGVGRAMTQWVIDRARAAGARELVLWSDTRFESAHRMYESLGFVRGEVRDIDDSYNSREWRYTLGL